MNRPIVSPYPYHIPERTVTDKNESVAYYCNYFLTRTCAMFDYTGLPDTIPVRNLELLLQTNGCVYITRHDGKLYAMTGGGYDNQLSPYGDPVHVNLVNVALPTLKTPQTIGADCEIIRNDALYMGLLPMIARYAVQLAENDITLRVANINSRIAAIFSASDDGTKASAELFMKRIVRGDLSVIRNTSLFDKDSLMVFPAATTAARITDLVELHQYLLASCYNDLGLQAGWNAKRAQITSDELSLNNNALLPLVDEMLRERQEGCDRVNRLFGTEISVRLRGAWKLQQEDAERKDETEVRQDDEPEDGT